jgi:hypothetical protein
LPRCRIALVGNGIVRAEQGPEIDAHDLVVRFNSCRHYGTTGYRTDVLVLINTGPAGRQLAREGDAINPAALAAARSFWIAKSADVAAAEFERAHERPTWDGPWDHASEIVERLIGSRPWRCLGANTFHAAQKLLLRHGASEAHQPSTGMLVLCHAKQTFWWPRITLFGFNHEGWSGHPWNAERSLIDSWRTSVRRVPLHPTTSNPQAFSN